MYWRYRLAESGHIVAHVAHTLDVVKEVTARLPLDDDMRSFWDEHMARHERLWESGRARYAAAGHPDAAPTPWSKTPQAGPEKRRPAASRRDTSRRSLTRPDKC